MRGIDLLQRRLLYLGGLGGWGTKIIEEVCSYPGLHPLLGATGRMAGFYKRPLWFFPSPDRLCLYAWPWLTGSPSHSPGRTRWCSTKKKKKIRETFYTLQKSLDSHRDWNFLVIKTSFTWIAELRKWVHVKDAPTVCEVSYLWLGLNVLAEQPLLIEGVAGLPCNGIYRSLVDLLFDCTQQQEKRLTHCFLQRRNGEKCSRPFE